MESTSDLAALGLQLPSPAYIVGAVLFGLVGWVAFRRGRKAARPELTWTGLTLMLYPYAVSDTWMLWAIGAGLCGWLYTKWK